MKYNLVICWTESGKTKFKRVSGASMLEAIAHVLTFPGKKAETLFFGIEKQSNDENVQNEEAEQDIFAGE